MATYDYICEKCKETYEITMPMSSYLGGLAPECECGWYLKRLYSPISAVWHTNPDSNTKVSQNALKRLSETRKDKDDDN